jgi:Amt family ammonium transporter
LLRHSSQKTTTKESSSSPFVMAEGVNWVNWTADESNENADSKCNLDSGDTAFMMFAATVVMMQTPAMGMAQAGMIRRKNSLSMLMQVLFGMLIGSLLWAMVGFSLAFGPSTKYGIIGNPFYHFGLRNVPIADCLPQLADSIPGALFCAFHMMFALMAPLVVTGSWAEKMTFEAFLVFVFFWPIIVYYPMVHWVRKMKKADPVATICFIAHEPFFFVSLFL